ncbi:MAG: DivIVA domain-containing protein [Clostridia bacterium]|nr:DivIVA domain-containing protein [Clostridia bacterium]
MLSSNDVREVKFSKAMGGYKQDEVDAFLDTVEENYKEYEAYVKSMQQRVDALNSEITEYRTNQNSLQNVLLSAQQLADNIVNEAKAKAEQIINDAKNTAEAATAEAKNMLGNFDAKLTEKKANAEKELKAELEKANAQKTSVEAAAADAVKRQQALFDKIRIEVAAFKNDLMEQYKKHIEILSKLPDNVAMDATRAAEAIALVYDEQIDAKDFLPATEPKADINALMDEDEQESVPEMEPELEQEEINEAPVSKGFVVNAPEVAQQTPMFEEDEAEEESGGFGNKFFSRNK